MSARGGEDGAMPPAEADPVRGIEIEIADLQRQVAADRTQIRRVARHVLRAESHPRASVSIALVDDARMAELHERYLGIAGPTDVLTFPLGDEEAAIGEEPAPLCGEIVVSTETAARQAAEHRLTPHDELLLYIVHGLLHLCGYDDIVPEDREKMWQRQQQLLDQIPPHSA